MEKELIGEIGMSIIDPDTHYVADNKRIGMVKEYIREKYGIDPTDEVVDAFISNEEDLEIVRVQDEHAEYLGFQTVEVDNCENGQDRFFHLWDCTLTNNSEKGNEWA